MPEHVDDPEDAKLVTLARAARARTGAAEGAAVRDVDGRTYAGASLSLPSLELSAVGLCVAMALASGSAGLEAVVVLGEPKVREEDLDVVRDFAGGGIPVYAVSASGVVLASLST